MNPTSRFSGRAAVYARHRPSYPDALFHTLKQAGLPDAAQAADLGAGTGISSEFLLRHGCQVTAVEPNDEMRSSAREWLGACPGFRVVSGTAESTGLESGSYDLVAAFQAGHWFHFDQAVGEMSRLARPGGLLAFAWNLRGKDRSEFDRKLERLLNDDAVDYSLYEERRVLTIGSLTAFSSAVFRHQQVLRWDSLRGLVQSWSFVPPPGHANHDRFFAQLRREFDEQQRDGAITLVYDCHLYWRLTATAW